MFLNAGVSPQDFWSMTMEGVAGLSYWIENKGEKRMSRDEYLELKRKVEEAQKKG